MWVHLLHSLILASLWVRPHLSLEACWCIAEIKWWKEEKKSKNVHPQVSIFMAGPLCPRARVISLMRFSQNLNPCVKCRCHKCLQKTHVQKSMIWTQLTSFSMAFYIYIHIHMCIRVYIHRTKIQRPLTIGIVHIIINISFPTKKTFGIIILPWLRPSVIFAMNVIIDVAELNWTGGMLEQKW